MSRTIPYDKVILSEDRWSLVAPDIPGESKHSSILRHLGWACVIVHKCKDLKGAPYWMLIEKGYNIGRCAYCTEAMPDSIKTSFVMLNWHKFNRG